jgi:hypothetical protein
MNGAAESELRNVTLTLSASCEHCAQPIPVNGPVQVARCPHCSKRTPVPKLFEVLCLAAGQMHPTSEFQFKWFDAPVVDCVGCGNDVDLAPYLRVEGALPAVACPRCHAAVHVYPVPTWLKELHPTAVHVFGGDEDIAAEQGGVALTVNEAASRPIAMACPACGAGLTITKDDARTAACKFCSASVFIPEDLWKQLHPVKIMRRWTVSYTGKLRSEMFDLLEQARMLIARQRSGPGDIVCPKCAKHNPGHYEFCLGCGAFLPRDGTSPASADPRKDASDASAAGNDAQAYLPGRGSRTALYAVLGGLVLLLVAGGLIFALGSPSAPTPAPAKPHAAQKR